ncbi:MAG: class I SAM-dependent methyltransferase [Acidobacteriota bacterium]
MMSSLRDAGVYIALKAVAAAFLSTMLPARTELIRREFTMPFWNEKISNNVVDRLIRFHIARAAGKSPDGAAFEQLHRNFWQKQNPEGWYESTHRRALTEYVPFVDRVLPAIIPFLERYSIERICDIGTGSGAILNHLREMHGGTVNRFTGIDLSASEMEKNRFVYPEMEFITADAVQWIPEHATDRTMYLTVGGVFEYLSQGTLEKTLRNLRQRTDDSIVVLICEPMETEFDLERDLQSRPFGSELSFLHNYPHLLSHTGWRVEMQMIETVGGQRAITLVAVPQAIDPPVPNA